MSGFGNGSPVTWRELNLVIDPVKSDLKEIRHEFAELRAELAANRILSESRSFLGGRGRTVVNGLLIAVPSAFVAVVVSYLH